MSKRKIYTFFCLLFSVLLIIQIYRYATDWLVVRRAKQFFYEAKNNGPKMFFRQRNLTWSQGYTHVIEANVPEGERILFIEKINIDGKVRAEKVYLYLFLQTYINRPYRFFYEMFENFSDEKSVIIYMKKNNYKYWATFIQEEQGNGYRYILQLFELKNGKLELVERYG